MTGFLYWSGAALWAAIAAAAVVFLACLLWEVGEATVFTTRFYDGTPYPVREWLRLWAVNIVRPCDRARLKSGRVIYWPGKEPVSKDFGASWERWLSELHAEMDRRDAVKLGDDSEAWRDFYEDGFTPRDAVDEEFTHGS